MLDNGIDYYLPYYENVTRKSDEKNRKSYKVLFPSYVPLVLEKPSGRLFDSKRVVSYIPIEAQLKFRFQLNQIDKLIQNNFNPLPVVKSEINNINSEIVITNGPLKGLTGYVIKILKKRMLLLHVEGLGFVSIHNTFCCKKAPYVNAEQSRK